MKIKTNPSRRPREGYPRKCVICHMPKDKWRIKTCSRKCSIVYARLYDSIMVIVKAKYDLVPKKKKKK